MKDVLFYDAVGMPYTGTTLRTGGLGGTEQFIVLLAEELVKEGLSVTVATKTAARTEVNGVEYVPLQDAPPTETLVHLRYGDLHCADFYKRRILFCTDSVDISLGSYDKYGHEFRKNTDLVVVCRWQLELFKQRGLTGWRSEHVITGILPESVLAKKTGKPPKYPHRFVYASAARKGLRETLEAWRWLAHPLGGDAELVITNPGYDVEEAARIYRSAPRPNTSLVGVLPSMDAVADLIAESAGLFYVNTYAECSSITLAMAEALGRRVHMLCKAGYGGTKDTIRSRLVTDNADIFRRDFYEALANPELARWYGEPYDFRASFVTKAWLALVKPGVTGSTGTYADRTGSYEDFVLKAVETIKALPSVAYPLSRVLELPDLDHAGLWLEFGVYEGRSLRMLAANRRAAKVFGFDSFKGLPEDWKAGVPKGSFAVNTPPVVDGAELVVGMFEDTLPTFNFSELVSLVHVDCDIGSAAQTALRAVEPNLADVSYVVFDELWNYDGFEKHEMRALYDQLVTAGYDVEFLYRSLDEQVACRVTRRRARASKDVAVVILCYKQAQFLQEAVASVRAQTCPAKEIVIVVGDEESHKAALGLPDAPISVVRDLGYGTNHAHNLGIAVATCPLIFPLDADDLIEPTCLEKMVAEVTDDRTIVASWMQEFGDKNGQLRVTKEMMTKGYMSPMCLFSRRLWKLAAISRGAHDVDEGYDIASPNDDYGFWLDCLRHNPSLRLVPELLVKRRMHAGSKTLHDPYDQFIAATHFLRPWRFPRTAADEGQIRKPELQAWVQKRLTQFPWHKGLLSLIRPPHGVFDASFQTPIRAPPGKLGLCMIVRNESKVIERCLKSVRPLLSYWTVVDTGSTDGTQALVRKALEGIPGELYERPWVDFSTNRNQALAFAEGHTSHVLVIDADDVLEIPEGYRLPEFTADGYHVRVEHGEYMHSRVHVFRPEKFCYRYVLHEGLFPTTNPIDYADLSGVTMRIMGGGHRNAKRNKFISDALVIKRALQKEPGDTRYAFYLAQSWRDAFDVGGNYDHLSKALRAYVRRADMGGDPEEIYLSLVEIARCREKLGHLREFVEEAYRDAFGYRSFRAEPLYYLARWLRMKYQDHTQAVIFARHAASLHKPTSERLFIEPSVYDWRALDEFVVCTTWLPFLREEGRSRIDELLRRAPSSEHERIRGMR